MCAETSAGTDTSATISGEEFEASGLCFDTVDDARDFARQSVEDSQHWLAANDVDFVKRYAEGDVYIVLKLRVGTHHREYDLVFLGVPRWSREQEVFCADPHVPDLCAAHDYADGHNQSVLVTARGAVQCPQQVVPSLVRLERPQVRDDLLRKIFAPAFDGVLQFAGTASEGEVCVLGVDRARGDRDGIHGEVERGSEVVERVSGKLTGEVGNRLAQRDLVRVVDAIRVGLNNAGVIYRCVPTPGLPLKVLNVALCACNPAA